MCVACVQCRHEVMRQVLAYTHTLSGDHAAKSDEEDDCFCVADEKGHKVCSPENCDSRKHNIYC